MQAIRVEQFAVAQWKPALHEQIKHRYLGARMEDQSAHVALVRLNSLNAWGKEDTAFWAALKEQGVIQRWEPLEAVPPPVKHNKAVLEDIGYRIGSGERLTPTQQEALLSQLLNLEARAIAAEKEASEQRDRADYAEAHASKTATTYNDLVAMLDAELYVSIYSQGDGWIVEDSGTGQVLVRHASIPEAYRVAIQHSLGVALQGGR